MRLLSVADHPEVQPLWILRGMVHEGLRPRPRAWVGYVLSRREERTEGRRAILVCQLVDQVPAMVRGEEEDLRSAVVVALAWLILRSGLLRCKDRTSKQQPRGMGLV